MRHIVVLAISILATAVGSAAADTQLWKALQEDSPREIARDQTDFWTRTLALTPEQAIAFHEISLRYASNMRLAAIVPGSDAQKLSTMESLEDQMTEEVLELLTPPQQKRYRGFAQHRERWVLKQAP